MASRKNVKILNIQTEFQSAISKLLKFQITIQNRVSVTHKKQSVSQPEIVQDLSVAMSTEC